MCINKEKYIIIIIIKPINKIKMRYVEMENIRNS